MPKGPKRGLPACDNRVFWTPGFWWRPTYWFQSHSPSMCRARPASCFFLFPGAPITVSSRGMHIVTLRAELAAYQKDVTAILRSHGAWELLNKLNRLKAEAKDVVVVLGRPTPEPEGPRIIRCAATREEAEEIEKARPVPGTI